MVSAAWRVDRSLFAATRNPIEPLPCPLVADVKVTQDTADDAVHVQSRVVSTETVPVPPLAGTEETEVDAVTWHFSVVGPLTLIEEDPQAAIRTDARRAVVKRTAGES